jgi:hypothetical protein
MSWKDVEFRPDGGEGFAAIVPESLPPEQRKG